MWCKHPDDASTVMYFMLSTLWMASLKISGLGLVKWLSILPALSPGKSLTTRPQNTSNIHVQQGGLRKKGAPGGGGGQGSNLLGMKMWLFLNFMPWFFSPPRCLCFLCFELVWWFRILAHKPLLFFPTSLCLQVIRRKQNYHSFIADSDDITGLGWHMQSFSCCSILHH